MDDIKIEGIKVDRGLSRGARSRFLRLLEQDREQLKNAQSGLAIDLQKICNKKKLSGSDVAVLIERYEKRSSYRSILHTKRMKYGKSSSATTLIQFFVRDQLTGLYSTNNMPQDKERVSRDDLDEDQLDILFTVYASRLFISRSFLELIHVPWFINIHPHLVERWCERTNRIDASPLIADLAENLVFIEYLRMIAQEPDKTLAISIPFRDGLALGVCSWFYTYPSDDRPKEIYRISGKLQNGSVLKQDYISHQFSNHMLYRTQKDQGDPVVSLRTFVTFDRMTHYQKIIHTRLIELRVKLKESLLDIFDSLLARLPGEVKLNLPAPCKPSLMQEFLNIIADVSGTTQELLDSGLWDKAIQLPSKPSYLHNLKGIKLPKDID